MPYLQVDVDALDAFDGAATMAGLTEGDISIGLLKLWLHCWKKKVSCVDRPRIASYFRGDLDKVIVALTVNEFLDMMPDGTVRVRGAEKRLGILKSRSEGGKKSRNNLKQFSESATGSPPAQAPARVELEPVVSSGSAPGLTSSIQHPASNLKEEEEDHSQPPPRASVAFVVEAPTTPTETWLGEDFWRWAQAKRQKAGWIAEKPPHHRKVSGWWSEAAMSGADVLSLKEAFYSFGNDPHWQKAKPPLPFVGFMDVWRNHLPRRKAS